MKIKLDENLGNRRVVSWLRQAGHDVMTVAQQKLTSAPDTKLIEICRQEDRILVTCDRGGFGNRMRFNPIQYQGIVVIRLPPNPNFDNWQTAIEVLIQGLEQANVTGKLWIIQENRLMEYQAIEPDME